MISTSHIKIEGVNGNFTSYYISFTIGYTLSSNTSMVNMSISGFIKGVNCIGSLGGYFQYDTHSIRDVEVSSSLTATSGYAGGILGYA